MTRMFDFDPDAWAARFAARGWVHVPGGVEAGFLELLRRQVAGLLERRRLDAFALGNKEQALYELPDGEASLAELVDVVARVTGLDRDRLVLSERHVKVYAADATAEVPAHKDRFASEIAVGLTIDSPPGSRLALYPDDDVGPNPFNSTAELWSALGPEHHPDARLAGARPVELEDSPGDVVLFRGSAIWHRRLQRAGATLLYLKLNSHHCDPLGEDPRSDGVRRRSEAMLEGPDDAIAAAVALPGRRVDSIERRFGRDGSDAATVRLWNGPALLIDDTALAALRAMDGVRTVRDVLEKVDGGMTVASIRRLVERGIVDLAPVALGALHVPEVVGGGRRVAATGG